jgi:hypothetical protein
MPTAFCLAVDEQYTKTLQERLFYPYHFHTKRTIAQTKKGKFGEK